MKAPPAARPEPTPAGHTRGKLEASGFLPAHVIMTARVAAGKALAAAESRPALSRAASADRPRPFEPKRRRAAALNRNYVQVTNPVQNGNGRSPRFMGRKEATIYVDTGRAEWLCNEGGCLDQIRLVESNLLNREDSIEAVCGYYAAAGHGREEYKGLPVTLEELRHVPVVKPLMLLTDRSVRATRRAAAGRTGPVTHVDRGSL